MEPLLFPWAWTLWILTWGACPGMILVHSYSGPQEKSVPKPMGLVDSYTYDGINLILQAITRVGLERESIRDYILHQDHPKGITGPVSFDKMGNRSGKLQLH